jgi:hypothetical protein
MFKFKCPCASLDPAHPAEDSQPMQENQANIQKGSKLHLKVKTVALIAQGVEIWNFTDHS